MRVLFSLAVSFSFAAISTAAEPTAELATKLAKVKFDHYAEAPGYSEGPTWRNDEVFFCSGALLRIDAKHKVHKYLEINPAGTVLRGDGHLLVADNKYKAILDVSPAGKVNIVVDQFETFNLRSLNDLTIDARGNVYWTDPEGSTPQNPVGQIFRVRPDGRVDRMATGLAFPNGLDVDPAGKFLYVIESQSKKILRFEIPTDNELFGKPEVFYDLAGSGGDGCAFDAAGNLWVADYHRPETKTGRITVLSPEGKVLAYVPVPAKVVSNIAFGGHENDEIYCSTGEPPGVFHAKVGIRGFTGHPGKPMKLARPLNVVALTPHKDSATIIKLIHAATEAKIVSGKIDPDAMKNVQSLIAAVTDFQVRGNLEKLLPKFEQESPRHAKDRVLLAEIKRLGGKATLEVQAADWLRSMIGDEELQLLGHIVEIELNERTDGHKEPTPKKLSDRVTDDWLKNLSDQHDLRRLELSGTAITSAGLVHLKHLTKLEKLNVCLTTVNDAGFEHLSAMTMMRRMTICSSQITGSGFHHLQGMKQIESINLHSAPASDSGLEAIGKHTSLLRLEIVHTNVTDAGLQHLAELTNLRQLHIHGPKATESALPFLSQLKELYQLDVYDHAASNQTLEQIGKLPKLRFLMLVNGTFDNEGIKHLSNLVTLEELSLNSSKITDAGVQQLSKLTNLRKLHLSGAQITPAGRNRLKALLPKVELDKP